MKALRFGFYFLISMVLIRALTLIAIFNPEIYWVSPISAIIELLLDLGQDKAAAILAYIIYPLLFNVAWLIIYSFIFKSNSNRYFGKLRFMVLSALGVFGILFSVFIYYVNYSFMASGEIDFILMIAMSTISGFFGIFLIIMVLVLPNFRYLTTYKIVEVVSFILNYAFLILILPILAYSVNNIGRLYEIANLFFGFVNILAFYYLMRYLEYEQGDEFISKETYRSRNH